MSMKLILAAAAVALSAGIANAAVFATNAMQVQATVNPSCTTAGIGTYDFGTLGGTDAVFTQTATSFTVNCSAGLAYLVKISTAAGNVTGTRQMIVTAGTQTMDYSLEFQDPNTGVFSTWTDGAFPSRTGNSLAQNIVFRGVVPIQTPSGGAWTLSTQFVDTVTITVEN